MGVCTPPGENGTNLCASGLACTGAQAANSAAGTKTCASSSLSQDLVAAGGVCTPPGENGTNPCVANHKCNGAKKADAAAGTKTCKAVPPPPPPPQSPPF